MNQPHKSEIQNYLRESAISKSKIEDPLRAAALAMPGALAVVTPTQRFTYAALDRRVTAAAAGLRALGLAPGTRLGLCLPNEWSMLVLVLGAIRAGLVACPISTRTPPQGVVALVQRVSASLLITARGDLEGPFAEACTGIAPEAVVDEEDSAASEVSASTPGALALDQPATIVFTSGSTGAAKAALHSVGNHYFSAQGANANIALAPGDRWLLALSLYHVGGLGIVFRCVMAGATVVVPAHGLPVGTAVQRHGITHLSLVATQLGRLLREEEGALEGLKAVLVGGGAVPPALIETAYRRGLPIHTTYGLTEMTSQVTTTPPDTSPDRLATAGRCLPHRQLRIADDGAILVRGAVRFQGYVDGDTLHTPFDADGWFYTGDRGVLDDAGYLRVLGRTDAMFISGGENIYPEEIEQALCALDGVRQAVVVPVEDAEFGQRPVAFVEVAGDLPAGAVLAAHLEAQVPRFKIPVAFYPWPADAPPGLKPDRAFFGRCAARTHRAEK